MRPAGSGKPDHTDLAFVERFARATRIRTLILRRLLRAHRHDFPRNGRIAAIVCDEIGDQIRIRGRYEDIDLKEIEALIGRVLDDEKLRQSLRNAATKTARDDDWQTVSFQYIDLCREVIREAAQ